MKKSLVAFAMLLSSFTFSSVFAQSQPAPGPAEKLEYLYVEVAAKGTLMEMAEKQNSPTNAPKGSTYELKLINASPYVKYFTNRPARVTGMMTVEEFLKEWSKSFAEVPPNAGVYGLQGNKPINAIMELSDPVYDAKSKTLTFTARALDNQVKLPKQAKFQEVAIFIDGYCAICVGK